MTQTLSQHLSGAPYLIPLAHTALFSLVSIRTSGVFICLYANFLMALMARGARLLNPLKKKLHHRSHNNSLDSWANWTIIFSLKLLIIWTPQFFISNSTRQQKKSRDFPSLIHTDTSDAEIVCQSVGLSNETLQGETRNGERLMRVF